jgi:hypothetical protein
MAGVEASARLALMFLLAGLGCGKGEPASADAAVVGSETTDAASSTGVTDAASAPACGAPAAPADLCKTLPTGTVTACSRDSAGHPSPTGYLEIAGAGGAPVYGCATSWSDGATGGYWFGYPDQFMSNPQSCCGAPATPAAAPTAPPPALGPLGTLHAAKDLKPQETAQPGAGLIRQNPFAVIVRDRSGAAAFLAALPTWLAWAGDGSAHPGPDGAGAYYFPANVLVNYTILEGADALPVVVIGPEVSLTADGKTPLGHPTLGACATGGGAPIVLMAGDMSGTVLTNHSGRFGHDSSVTPEALDDAAKLFNCLGIPIASTTYYPPKP